MALLKDLERASPDFTVPLTSVLDALPYNEQGLIAAIAQDATTRQVLMLAWMDRTAIERTIEQGQVWYFSRSRNTYWRKGETSGHTQQLVNMAFDCDGDAVLLEVNQTGAACHTSRSHCFYLQVHGEQVVVTASPTESHPTESQHRNNLSLNYACGGGCLILRGQNSKPDTGYARDLFPQYPERQEGAVCPH